MWNTVIEAESWLRSFVFIKWNAVKQVTANTRQLLLYGWH
jgi:hypothetical protein